MFDYVSIGPAPANERCASVGEDDYHQRSVKECRAFIGQLRRALGEEPEGASFSVKTHPHDFGAYREVVCYYDDRNEAAVAYAFDAEAKAPAEWDELARAELGLAAAVAP